MRGAAKHYYNFLPALRALLIPNTTANHAVLKINPIMFVVCSYVNKQSYIPKCNEYTDTDTQSQVMHIATVVLNSIHIELFYSSESESIITLRFLIGGVCVEPYIWEPSKYTEKLYECGNKWVLKMIH